ncbi:hypothetical protein TNCV_4140091 [Trichonephila clavipes]|nr:hypothetical protein TNCV_4140091 [Trichonephila clavipes]
MNPNVDLNYIMQMSYLKFGRSSAKLWSINEYLQHIHLQEDNGIYWGLFSWNNLFHFARLYKRLNETLYKHTNSPSISCEVESFPDHEYTSFTSFSGFPQFHQGIRLSRSGVDNLWHAV